MSCDKCNDKDSSCDINVRKITGGLTPTRDPGDTAFVPTPPAGVPGASTGLPTVPGGPCGCSTNTNGGGGFATSNCMFGPSNETVCERQKRQLQYENSVETATGTIDLADPTPTFVDVDGGLGFSQYENEAGLAGDESTPHRYVISVPAHRLTDCSFICEFHVRVVNGANVKYDGPAGGIQGRSSYYAAQNNVADAVSQPNGQKFGRRILTYDGHCACDCIKLWHTYDIPGQVEFDIPGVTLAADDVITVQYQVTRVYTASKECAFPNRCGEDGFLPPYVGAAA